MLNRMGGGRDFIRDAVLDIERRRQELCAR
jgi:hypothetical protein